MVQAVAALEASGLMARRELSVLAVLVLLIQLLAHLSPTPLVVTPLVLLLVEPIQARVVEAAASIADLMLLLVVQESLLFVGRFNKSRKVSHGIRERTRSKD
jgi:hypothetical protein